MLVEPKFDTGRQQKAVWPLVSATPAPQANEALLWSGGVEVVQEYPVPPPGHDTTESVEQVLVTTLPVTVALVVQPLAASKSHADRKCLGAIR